MPKSFKKLRAKMAPARRTRNRMAAEQMLREMPLAELREARDLTQEQLAKVLRVKQAAVSRLESRTDMYLSTVEGVVKAMGGELEILARFPDGVVRIRRFRELQKRKPSAS